MNTTRLSLLTIAAALALAGCGNKGPLVLPDAPEEEAPVVVDETDTAANPAAGGAEAATDEDTTDGGAIDDPDAPVEPEPLPQDDGAGGCALADRLPAPVPALRFTKTPGPRSEHPPPE